MIASAAGRRALLALLALIGLALVAWYSGWLDPILNRGRAAEDRYAEGPAVCTEPAGIPDGFDYPQAEGAIQVWVGNRDEKRARRHGWYLWAGLNSLAEGGPVWRGWCTSTQAFAAEDEEAPAAGIHRMLSLGAFRRTDSLAAAADAEPIFLPGGPAYPVPEPVQAAFPQCYMPPHDGQPGQLRDGPTYQNNGDLMVAGVIYNRDAYKWIRNKDLYLGSTLAPLVPPTDRTARMPLMPPGSIVLKPMMWPVPATGYTALPVWDDVREDGGRYAGFEVQSKWPRAVALTARRRPEVTRADVSFLYNLPVGPNNYADAPVADLRDFYAFRPKLEGMDPCDRAILDASAWWAYNRPFQQGDFLAVVAMHILTKEQPAWTFQSVWWHDRADRGPFAADRPDIPAKQAPGPWRHYLLTSTYGIPAAPGARSRAALEGPGAGPQWPVAFNPYIELAADHPIQTNCMNCHHRAAWPGFQLPPPSWPTASYLAANGPGALDIFRQDDSIFNGLLGSDSMWAISDRVPVPAGYKPPAARGGAASPKPR